MMENFKIWRTATGGSRVGIYLKSQCSDPGQVDHPQLSVRKAAGNLLTHFIFSCQTLRSNQQTKRAAGHARYFAWLKLEGESQRDVYQMMSFMLHGGKKLENITDNYYEVLFQKSSEVPGSMVTSTPIVGTTANYERTFILNSETPNLELSPVKQLSPTVATKIQIEHEHHIQHLQWQLKEEKKRRQEALIELEEKMDMIDESNKRNEEVGLTDDDGSGDVDRGDEHVDGGDEHVEEPKATGPIASSEEDSEEELFQRLFQRGTMQNKDALSNLTEASAVYGEIAALQSDMDKMSTRGTNSAMRI